MSIPYMTSWEQFAGKLASDINDYVSDYNFSETKTLEYTSPENYSVYICLKRGPDKSWHFRWISLPY